MSIRLKERNNHFVENSKKVGEDMKKITGWILCWNCGKKYDLDAFGLQQTNVQCSDCGGTIISNSGKVKVEYVEQKGY